LGVRIHVHLLNDGGDRFNPTAIIAPPEFSIKISKIYAQVYTSLHKCKILWNTLEQNLEKSREIRGIPERSVTSFSTYSGNVLVAFMSSYSSIFFLNFHKCWTGSQLASLSSSPFRLTRSSCVGGWLECRTTRSAETSSTSLSS